jgi:DNA-binding beta-propeller fold protein YncE
VTGLPGLRVGWSPLEYAVDPDWLRPPDGIAVGPVTAVAAANDGRLYVCHRSQPSVLIVDSAGSVMGALGEDTITDPHGITTDANGNVYVADRDRHVVLIFDAAGRLIKELGTRDSAAAEAPFNHPADVAVAGDGAILVADGYGNSRVHVFSPTGVHMRSWGTHGHKPGQFRVPHGIAVDADDRVYVTDRENDRVQIFDRLGNVLDVWEDFRGPTDVCIDGGGRVFVTDHVPTLTALNAAGDVLFRVRTYHDTHGVCCDRFGNVFVASTAGRAVIAYTPLHL